MSRASRLANNLDEIIADYLRRIDRGETVDRERFIQSHRGLAAELTEFFCDLDSVSRHVVPARLESSTASDLTQSATGRKQVREFVRMDARHQSADGSRRQSPGAVHAWRTDRRAGFDGG